jgi:hypothetical protein
MMGGLHLPPAYPSPSVLVCGAQALIRRASEHQGTTLTIHGRNDNPTSVLPLSERATREGTGRATFAYDDLSRRMEDNTKDLVNGIRALLSEHPDAPLTINAFSTGARMAAVALGRLEKSGALEDREVRLNLVAPVLRGSNSANAAAVVSWLDRRMQSEIDMGSLSKFQAELASTRLRTVTAQVYGGTADAMAPVSEEWTRMARELTGREPLVLQGSPMSRPLRRSQRCCADSPAAWTAQGRRLRERAHGRPLVSHARNLPLTARLAGAVHRPHVHPNERHPWRRGRCLL